MRRVCGFGINDADYVVYPTINGKRSICPYYHIWKNMLVRSLSSNHKKNNPSYIGCSVSEDWKKFTDFKSWMEKQDWKGKFLDKDILFEGNKVYSPETCVFLDRSTNNLLTRCEGRKGEWPIGVSFFKGSGVFKAECNNHGKKEYLGYYGNPLEAHHEYLKLKIKIVRKVAYRQKDDRVKASLLIRSEAMNKAIISGSEYLPS